MIFYRCELRDNHPSGPTDMHYADSFELALEYCKSDISQGHLEMTDAYWIWKEETGYDKDTTQKIGSISSGGEFVRTEDEPEHYCDFCNAPIAKEQKYFLSSYHQCDCTVYCSDACVEADLNSKLKPN